MVLCLKFGIIFQVLLHRLSQRGGRKQRDCAHPLLSLGFSVEMIIYLVSTGAYLKLPFVKISPIYKHELNSLFLPWSKGFLPFLSDQDLC